MLERKYCAALLAGLVNLVLPGSGTAQQMTPETVKGMLAAQIRSQGFTCDNAQKATRDARRSRPDRGVWVLECNNATYRVSRAPDMSATVERLR